MPAAFRHAPLRAAALVAAVTVAACSGHSSSGDDALRRDLNAAGGDGLALAPRGSQTQVVSALELANGKANPAGPPARATTGTPMPAPPRFVARAAAPVVERIRIIERVIDRDPAPAPTPARTEVAAAPAPAPEPSPAAADPAPVAAPSPGSRQLPQSTDAPVRGRHHHGTWDMGDVIRNAPFPINP